MVLRFGALDLKAYNTLASCQVLFQKLKAKSEKKNEKRLLLNIQMLSEKRNFSGDSKSKKFS